MGIRRAEDMARGMVPASEAGRMSNGRSTVKVVPTPCSEENVIVPPRRSTSSLVITWCVRRIEGGRCGRRLLPMQAADRHQARRSRRGTGDGAAAAPCEEKVERDNKRHSGSSKKDSVRTLSVRSRRPRTKTTLLLLLTAKNCEE